MISDASHILDTYLLHLISSGKWFLKTIHNDLTLTLFFSTCNSLHIKKTPGFTEHLRKDLAFNLFPRGRRQDGK